MGFSIHTFSAQRGGTQPHEHKSQTLNAQSTATELARNPDMRRNIPKASLLNPHPKVREKNSAAGEHHARKEVHIFHVHILRIMHL